jgi:hypothetical protein
MRNWGGAARSFVEKGVTIGGIHIRLVLAIVVRIITLDQGPRVI